MKVLGKTLAAIWAMASMSLVVATPGLLWPGYPLFGFGMMAAAACLGADVFIFCLVVLFCVCTGRDILDLVS